MALRLPFLIILGVQYLFVLMGIDPFSPSVISFQVLILVFIIAAADVGKANMGIETFDVEYAGIEESAWAGFVGVPVWMAYDVFAVHSQRAPIRKAKQMVVLGHLWNDHFGSGILFIAH